jgi:hypothetical protein
MWVWLVKPVRIPGNRHPGHFRAVSRAASAMGVMGRDARPIRGGRSGSDIDVLRAVVTRLQSRVG